MNETWEGAHGGCLRVEDCTITGSPHARVVVEHGMAGPLVACVAPGDLVDVSVALWRACGLPVPVITPRPEVDASGPLDFRGFRLHVDRGRTVRVAVGAVYEVLPPHAARQLAGLLAAYADAAEILPDPADVDALALVLMEGNPTVMGLDGARPTARRILAAGYRREVPGNGD